MSSRIRHEAHVVATVLTSQLEPLLTPLLSPFFVGYNYSKTNSVLRNLLFILSTPAAFLVGELNLG